MGDYLTLTIEQVDLTGTVWQWVADPDPEISGRTFVGRFYRPYSPTYVAGASVIAGIFHVDVDGDTLHLPLDNILEGYWQESPSDWWNIGNSTFDVTIELGESVTGDITGVTFCRSAEADELPYGPDMVWLTFGTGSPLGPWDGGHSTEPPPEPGSGVYAATVNSVVKTTQSGYELVWLTITPPAAAVNVADWYIIEPGNSVMTVGSVEGVTNTASRPMPPAVANTCFDTGTEAHTITVRPEFNDTPEDADYNNDATVVTFTSESTFLGTSWLSADPDEGDAPLDTTLSIYTPPT